MKNYALKENKNFIGSKVTLTNLDVEPSGVHSCLIASVVFSAQDNNSRGELVAFGTGQKKMLSMDLFFREKKETKEIKKRFEDLPSTYKNLINFEALKLQGDMKGIIPFIELIQQIDPIPVSALLEVQALTKMDFSIFLCEKEVIQLASEKKYEEALEKALEIQEKDDQKSLISLGKYLEKAFENQQQALIKYVGEDEKARRVMKLFYEGYYEAKSHPKANNILVEFTHLKSILDNYTQVIKNISIKCAERESMSLAAYKMLLPFELTHDLVERDKIMTQLFQFSFEANFHESAFKYFNKLCCKEEKDFFSFEIKPQASTLIATAKEHKRKLKEIERLEEKLDEKQTLIETLKRQLDAEKSVSTIHPAAC